MQKELNRLTSDSYNYRAIADHPSHRDLKRKSRIYGKANILEKWMHWTEYLENMVTNDIWTANKYIRDLVGDGGIPRIPTVRDAAGNETEINDSEDKAKIFAKLFFPPLPDLQEEDMALHKYPEPLPNLPPLVKSQIKKIICKPPSYKAPGPDSIPNIVLQKCYEIIADHLLHIFQAILALGEFTTIVLRKPDKPNYKVLKAYRPITLISTMAKVLTALIADNISRLVEQHQLLPKTHFGSRVGKTTTDAIHYLVHKVKQAWENNQVASILFMDVEGTFPNAVTDCLIHNLK